MITALKNDFISITVNSKGAELTSLKIAKKEYIWNGDAEFWGKHSPVLFPIVGTLKNNTYSFENKNYQLSRHGFARDLEFEVKKNTTNCMIFSLMANDKTLENYPFDFELQIKYTLQEKKLLIAYKVFNKSDKKMPFSIGAHPAFALPDGFENYSLAFSDAENPEYYLLEKGLIGDQTQTLYIKDKILPIEYKTFEKDALVFKKLKSTAITILENSNPYIKVDFSNFPNLGLWTVQDADFICIEPWFGYSDTTNSTGNILEKEGIIIVDKNESFNTEFSIEIM